MTLARPLLLPAEVRDVFPSGSQAAPRRERSDRAASAASVDVPFCVQPVHTLSALSNSGCFCVQYAHTLSAFFQPDDTRSSPRESGGSPRWKSLRESSGPRAEFNLGVERSGAKRICEKLVIFSFFFHVRRKIIYLPTGR
jgi:hypothetical protein